MNYSKLRDQLYSTGGTAYRLAKGASVSRQSVAHFFAGRVKKAGKANCRKIRAALREIGIIKPRPKHPCPNCASVHVIKNKSTQPQENQ